MPTSKKCWKKSDIDDKILEKGKDLRGGLFGGKDEK